MGALRRGYVTARRWLSGLLFERRHHLQTEAEIQLGELGLAGEERVRYKAAGWLTLRRILPDLKLTAVPDLQPGTEPAP